MKQQQPEEFMLAPIVWSTHIRSGQQLWEGASISGLEIKIVLYLHS